MRRKIKAKYTTPRRELEKVELGEDVELDPMLKHTYHPMVTTHAHKHWHRGVGSV